ncbi:MAG: cobalamin-dependent protein, partial [Longicatena sp.]
ALLSAMGVVGDKFKNNLVFVPEVLIAARAMNKGIEILKPYLSDENNEPKGKIILGTVKGDLHDIGKNLVKIMMEGKGIEVIDLGVDVPSERFVEAAKEYNVKLICCSALLTTTMGEMKNVVNLVNADKDLAGKAKVMIGGAPVTQAFCDEIGANIFTDDAASAAEVALQNLN